MPVLVSVILPVYNTSEFLDRCIRSITNQTLKSIELIVVDDGSTDGSGEIADKYASQDNRINVIHQENAGVAAARNTGIAAARGEYITFIDSDDYANERLCEVLYNTAQENRADVASCSAYRIGENTTELLQSQDRIIDMSESTRPPVIDRCIFGDYRYRMSVWGKLYKKSLFDDYDITFWGNRMEDAIVNIKILMVAEKVRILSDLLYYYHRRPNTLTTTVASSPLYPIQQVSMVRQIQDFGIKYGILDRIDEMLPQYYLMFLKRALISVEKGNTYPYIYSVLKKLYYEDAYFKKYLARIKTPRQGKSLRERMRAAYRNIFTWTCSHGWLRIAAFLYWRQQRPNWAENQINSEEV